MNIWKFTRQNLITKLLRPFLQQYHQKKNQPDTEDHASITTRSQTILTAVLFFLFFLLIFSSKVANAWTYSADTP